MCLASTWAQTGATETGEVVDGSRGRETGRGQAGYRAQCHCVAKNSSFRAESKPWELISSSIAALERSLGCARLSLQLLHHELFETDATAFTAVDI